MATTDTLTHPSHFFAKKSGDSYIDPYAQERAEHIARASLCGLVQFHDALADDIQRLTNQQKRGTVVDKELLDKMRKADICYAAVMRGFKENEYPMQRNALIAFADAVQDIMIHLNLRRH